MTIFTRWDGRQWHTADGGTLDVTVALHMVSNKTATFGDKLKIAPTIGQIEDRIGKGIADLRDRERGGENTAYLYAEIDALRWSVGLPALTRDDVWPEPFPKALPY